VSNEPPPLAECVELLLPLPDDPVLVGRDPPAGEGDAPSGAGRVDGWGCEGGEAALGASRATDRLGAETADIPATATAVDGLRGFARPCTAVAEEISIRGASLSRIGITALTDAAGGLDGASARAASPDFVARPIAKDPANTAHRDTTAMGTRRSMRALPPPAPRWSLWMRTVFMSWDTPSACLQPDQDTCQRAGAACHGG
jgi:hypothetical protein